MGAILGPNVTDSPLFPDCDLTLSLTTLPSANPLLPSFATPSRVCDCGEDGRESGRVRESRLLPDGREVGRETGLPPDFLILPSGGSQEESGGSRDHLLVRVVRSGRARMREAGKVCVSGG